MTLPQLLWAGETIPGTVVRVSSPDRQLVLTFYQKQLQPQKRAMYYHLERNGKPLVLESLLDVRMDNRLSENAMALKVDEHADWCENLVVEGIRTGAHDSTWTPLNGESATVRDQYNYANVELKKDDNPIYEMHVQIRVYNQGAAIRYYLPENPKGTYYNITDEKTEFSLPEGTMAWVANWAQAPYQKLPLHNWPGESERPLTVELPGQQYLCLAEAGLVDYARTKYKLSDKPSTIVTSMFGEAQLISPIATPWRAIIVADHPGGLIENNSLLLNLNEACRIKDTGWIQPGKIMRVMTQTTVDARANIDFAAQQKLQYILFDWKWYGPAFSFQSDATHVAIPDFNLPDIIDYARQKGIGVWLYVNQQALLAQSDSLFRIYQRWGVKGVKFGFVQSGSHRWTTWIEKAIRQAADSHVMVNIHDDWRPTGEQRTWPNLMTAEGIKGNEEMPDATHNTILPFTRYIAGPADYTICYFDHRIKTTHAHQLALAAIYYSPIQTLFWYDHPSQYHQEPELEFWSEIPTTWDETRIIQGMPGEYITTARRKGTEWFVGTITNNEARSLKVALSFLTPGKKYKAKIYSDDSSIATATHVRVGNMLVNSKTVLSISLQPSGGEAMQLEEIK
ncbi:glycoside hydrolase family 97 catalytic domain-containing protein [Mucilaginibacter dorajii]